MLYLYCSIYYNIKYVNLKEGYNMEYFIDKNGNKWSSQKYTREQAKKHSQNLVNCKDCIDCIGCVDCYGCKDCIKCVVCRNCNNCIYCISCKSCDSCKICKKSQECINCKNTIKAYKLNNETHIKIWKKVQSWIQLILKLKTIFTHWKRWAAKCGV